MDTPIARAEAIRLVIEFLDNHLQREPWYQNIRPYINGILLYGSVAKRTNRPDSDIDVLIILPLKHEKEYTSGEYFFDYRGWQINIVLRSIEKMRLIAKEGNNQFQKEVFRDCHILIADSELMDLLEKIDNI